MPFWGKCDRNTTPVTIHPLTDHCLDVGVTFLHVAASPRLSAALQACTNIRLHRVERERLAAIAYLHDIGKCNWGFQAKRDDNAWQTTGHVIEGAALLSLAELQQAWPPEWKKLLVEMTQWFDDGEVGLRALLLASISHHGRPASDHDVESRSTDSIVKWWRPHGGLDPMQGLTELALGVRRTFAEAFVTDSAHIVATAEFQQRFAGLVMLADWIASDTQFFPYRQTLEEDRLTRARASAARAVAAIGLVPPSRSAPAGFEATFGLQSPTPLQVLLASGHPTAHDARLMLVESETGSGKTEAALAWFLRLYAEGRVDGLYFALPTRVAARELYARVRRAIERAFPDLVQRPGPVLLAVPGYVRVDGEEPQLPNPDGRIWEDDDGARRRERAWSGERPKRFLAAPIAVGTVDQALLSVLQVKHSLLRSVCLDRHLLVVDEVHASDTYMRAVLRELLQGHCSRGGHALLLSATLGEAARSAFFGKPPLPLVESTALPYPALTDRSGTRTVRRTSMRKTVHVECHEDLTDATLLDPLHDALAAGARVLTVCNTVARANSLLRAVEADGRFDPAWFFAVNGVACPHHGRFACADREVLDVAVSSHFGKHSDGSPLLLIGTQTLEQSLDIDADWLVTDPCPMDVLLQRIGRLHRHRRIRPEGFERPNVLLRMPPGSDLTCNLNVNGSQFRGPAGIGRVYADPRIVQRTFDVLRERSTLVLPDDNRWLVEQCTHEDALERLPDPRWRRLAEEVYGRALQHGLLAKSVVLPLKPFGELHYHGTDERITTRLGDDGWTVTLAQPVSHCFGTLIDSLTVPHWLLGERGPWPESVDPEPIDGGFRFALGQRHYRYTRFGLEKDDDA